MLFFFRAEDGIRDRLVTGVQTCALPIFCIFAEGEVDRSPTGTGVSARAALHYARGEIRVGESVTIESIIGSTFSVQVYETTSIGNYDAVIPDVNGNAYITGKNTFWINPNDPLKDGFILR